MHISDPAALVTTGMRRNARARDRNGFLADERAALPGWFNHASHGIPFLNRAFAVRQIVHAPAAQRYPRNVLVRLASHIQATDAEPECLRYTSRRINPHSTNEPMDHVRYAGLPLISGKD